MRGVVCDVGDLLYLEVFGFELAMLRPCSTASICKMMLGAGCWW